MARPICYNCRKRPVRDTTSYFLTFQMFCSLKCTEAAFDRILTYMPAMPYWCGECRAWVEQGSALFPGQVNNCPHVMEQAAIFRPARSGAPS